MRTRARNAEATVELECVMVLLKLESNEKAEAVSKKKQLIKIVSDVSNRRWNSKDLIHSIKKAS
jgi:hypothetical protein